MTYWPHLLFHVLTRWAEGDDAEVVPTAEHEADAPDSARGWRFVDARYVFRNTSATTTTSTSGAVRFMADGRLFLSSQGFPCSLP